MPRTAVTTAQTHEGSWVALFLEDIPVDVQKQEVRKLRQSRTHPKYQRVHFREDDSTEMATRLRFLPEPQVETDEPKRKKNTKE